MGCYIWFSEESSRRDHSQPRPLLAVPNVTAHPSTTSVPITVLLYNGPLLCSFIVPIEWLILITLMSKLFVSFSMAIFWLSKVFCFVSRDTMAVSDLRFLLFSQPSIYIDGWLYDMSMTSVVCNVPVLSQNDSTYHHSVLTTWKWHPFATWTPSFIILVWGITP